MHFARPSFQQSQIGNVITRPKKIGASSSATWQPASLPFPSLPSPNPFLSLDRPEAVCRGVTTDTALRCSGAHFRRSQGSSDGQRECSTLHLTYSPNSLFIICIQTSFVHSVLGKLYRGLRYLAQHCTRLRLICNPHLVRDIFSIGFANLIYPPRRVSWPKWS